MHIPDGFIGAGVSAGAGAVALAGISAASRKAAAELDERNVPLSGLVAAFVFAAQMLSFPVAAGTSGHLLGGVLAAVLVGPWTGAMCLAVVVVVQALFADGGLTALGLNLLNLSLVACLGGYAVFRALTTVLPKTHSGVSLAAGLAGGASVVMVASAFLLEYWLGGMAAVPIGSVATAMLGVHTLIGIGEGVITGVAVGAVLGARPDLVRAGAA